MPRITLSIPDELKQELDKHPEVNWNERLRRRLKERVEKLKQFEKEVGWR